MFEELINEYVTSLGLELESATMKRLALAGPIASPLGACLLDPGDPHKGSLHESHPPASHTSRGNSRDGTEIS